MITQDLIDAIGAVLAYREGTDYYDKAEQFLEEWMYGAREILDKDTNTDFNPTQHDDPAMAARQFRLLVKMVNDQSKHIGYLTDKLAETSDERVNQLLAELESEREMNHELTMEIRTLT